MFVHSVTEPSSAAPACLFGFLSILYDGGVAGGPTGKRRSGSARSPGLVYSAMTAVVVLIIAALTITASQTPPPAIAELAPQAIQQIKDPPPDQASSVGSAEGGGTGTGGP